MFRLFTLLLTIFFAGDVASEERMLTPNVDIGSLWFKPHLVENNSPQCEKVLEDAQRYFMTEESFEKHYAVDYPVKGKTLIGMRQILFDSQFIVLPEKESYLHLSTHIGCGGGCNTYQLVATNTDTPPDLKSLLASSPPPSAPWYGLYEDSEHAYWLFLPDDSRDLLAYRLQGGGQWVRSCKVLLNPPQLDTAIDKDIKSAMLSLEKLKMAVGGITRGSGDCGSLHAGYLHDKKFSEMLPETLYRPWALQEEISDFRRERGLYEHDIAGMTGWSFTGTSEYESFKNYRVQLEETMHTLADFYETKFKWNRKISEGMARTAITSVISEALLFSDHYEPFKSQEDLKLRKAILNGDSLDIIKMINTDLGSLNRDGEESILSVAVIRPEVLSYLLSKGVSPNHENAFGKTPLMYAVQENQIESTRLLLEAGANANARTIRPNNTCYYALRTHGVTPLHYAVRYASPMIIRLLLDHGALPYLNTERYSANAGTPLEWFDRFTNTKTEGAPVSRYMITGIKIDKNPNMPKESIEEVREWLTKQPDDLSGFVNELVMKAEVLYKKKKVTESYEALSLALVLDPKHERALNNMALVALKNNKSGKSLQAAQLLIEISSFPKAIANAWFNQGLACESVKNNGMYGNVLYNGESYCQYGIVYPFYKSIKTEYSASRRNKLLEVLNNGYETSCNIPTRGVKINLRYGQDPDVKKFSQSQMLYVLRNKGAELSAEDLAWIKKTEERRVVPIILDSVDLGEQILMVLKSDEYIQFPTNILGYECTGKRQ